jgi:hypothetical protein
MELNSRRKFLLGLGSVGVGPFLPSLPSRAREKEPGIGPAEDLMREHGALNRILLIYEEGIRRLQSGREIDLTVIKKSAGIVHNFIENYHEKNEEEFVFPLMRKKGKLVELTKTLEDQVEQLEKSLGIYELAQFTPERS